MPSYRSGLGFSTTIPHAAQRHCYARASALDQLLAAPGSVELLLLELTGEPCPPGSVIEQLTRLKRQGIHLSVTRGPFYGLSLEEILVLCAYSSPHFAHSAFRRELLAEPSAAVLSDLCRTWLLQRASHIRAGEELGAPHWPLVGHTPHNSTKAAGGGVASSPRTTGEAATSQRPNGEAPSGEAAGGKQPNGEVASGEAPSGEAPSSKRQNNEAAHGEAAHGEAAHGEAASAASLFTVAVTPIPDATLLDRELPRLGHEAGFAHEHYLACTPATALDYVRRSATLGTTIRWDPFALDRRLRSLGLGLLLVEGREVTVYLPARYHPSRSGIFVS